MRRKLKVLICLMLICTVIPIHYALAGVSIDRNNDGIQIDDVVHYLSTSEPQSATDIRGIMNLMTPMVFTATYVSLTAAAKIKLETLKNSCRSELSALADQYFLTKNVNLIVQGYSMLGTCDSNFEVILSELQSDLTANGYSMNILEVYRNVYEQEKSQEIELLRNRLSAITE